MTDNTFDRARQFVIGEGRLLEQRLFETVFEDGPPEAVIDALRGFQNADGGFGHGLEPDKRCPASLPIDVEIALQAMVTAGASDPAMVARACDWLASVATPDGSVAASFPVMEGYPRASHWTDWTYTPGINPTAGLAGRLHALKVEHPFVDRASEWCWRAVEGDGDWGDAHAVEEVAVFLEHAPDRVRAEAAAARVPERLASAQWFKLDAASPEYGVTPLHFAPTPASPWRSLFADDVIAAHLDRLAADQQPDGGWPIAWEPPSRASTMEWRAIETLRAVRTLAAYGRL